jgi:hypothetical protein
VGGGGGSAPVLAEGGWEVPLALVWSFHGVMGTAAARQKEEWNVSKVVISSYVGSGEGGTGALSDVR